MMKQIPAMNATQLCYALYGLVLALHQQARFLGIAESSRHAGNAFERLVLMHRESGIRTTPRGKVKIIP